MQLQVNEKHEITGYATVGGFVGGIEAEASSLPEGFEESFAPGKYLYENGQIVENPNYESLGTRPGAGGKSYSGGASL